MDIEAVVARRLSSAVGAPAFLEVPAEPDMPDSFITVELTGGGGGFLEPAQLDIDCWAMPKQRKEAHGLAERVKAAAVDLDDEPNVFHPEVTNVYRMNDPDTRRARYVVQLQVWVCE